MDSNRLLARTSMTKSIVKADNSVKYDVACVFMKDFSGKRLFYKFQKQPALNKRQMKCGAGGGS